VTSPRVSVICIFYNAERFFAEAIESVLAQEGISFELLLVDDGSSDASTAMARDYAERFPEVVRYLQHDGHANLGMSATRNLGLARARGEYVALIDRFDDNETRPVHPLSVVGDLSGVNAVADQKLAHQFEAVAAQQAQLEIIVLEPADAARGVGFVEAAERQGHVAADHQGTAVAHMVSVKMLLEEVAARLDRRAVSEHFVGHADIAGKRVAGGPLLYMSVRRERGHLLLDLLRMPQIVGVEIGDIGRLRQPRAQVARRGHTGVGDGFHPHTFVRGGKALRDCAGPVGRPIVDDDDVEFGVGLPDDARQRALEELFLVVGRNDCSHAGQLGISARHLATPRSGSVQCWEEFRRHLWHARSPVDAACLP
jgi:hypothetical protein